MKRAFFAALVIPFTLALTAWGIYFANINELPGNPSTVLATFFVLASTGTALLFFIQLPFLGRKVSPWIATTLLTVGFLLWFQANVFNWNLGIMDGAEIPWKKYRPLGIFELFVYSAIIFAALHFRKKLLQRLVPISCTLIFIQAVPIFLMAIKNITQETTIKQVEQTGEQPEHNISVPTWKQYSFTLDNIFEFSTEENVVLIVLDGLGQNIFNSVQREYPGEIGEIFRDFTCFTNVMSDRPGTVYNIPQILTGCLSEEMPNPIDVAFHHRQFNRSDTLLKTLAEHQYRCDVFSWCPSTMYYDSRWIANIKSCQFNRKNGLPERYILANTGIPELTVLTLFRTTPLLLKRETINNNKLLVHLRSLFEKMDSSYRSLGLKVQDYDFNTFVQAASRTSFADRKTFKFIHLQGAHHPYVMDENCMKNKLFGIESGKRQAHGSLRIIRNILELMKESGVYDQSFVIIMSDHGPNISYTEGLLNPSVFTHPFFLIKRKYSQQSQLAYNNNPIHICETTPIILSELGILQGNDTFFPFELPESLVIERKDRWEEIRDYYNKNEVKPILDLSRDEKHVFRLFPYLQKLEWLELIALRPSQPLSDGCIISRNDIQREDLSVQDNVLQIDIRGDCVRSIKFDNTWKTTIALSAFENTDGIAFVSEKPITVIPVNPGGKVESWICFQKLKVDTLADGLYRIDVFFHKNSVANAQFKSSKALSVNTNEEGKKILMIVSGEYLGAS